MRPAPSSNHQGFAAPDFSGKCPTLLMSEAKQTWKPLAVPLSLSFTWNAFPANSKPPVSSCVSEPCKLNPCPSVCYLHVLTKAQGEETWALPEILPRLWTTIWRRKAVWKTLFQNKSSGTINPVYLLQAILNNTKNVSIKKNCLSQLLPTMFILQLRKNIPLTTMTLIVLCFGKRALERNA